MVDEITNFLNLLKKIPINKDAKAFIKDHLISFDLLEKLGLIPYVLDYQKGEYLYFGHSLLNILDIQKDNNENLSFLLVLNQIYPNDLKRILNIMKEGVDFILTVIEEIETPIETKCYFRILCKSGEVKWFLQSNKILKYHDSLIDLGCISLVSIDKLEPPGYLYIKYGKNFKFVYLKDSVLKKVKLTKRENEILFFAFKGFSISKTALDLGISQSGVRFHRKNILKKYHAKSFLEVKILRGVDF